MSTWSTRRSISILKHNSSPRERDVLSSQQLIVTRVAMEVPMHSLKKIIQKQELIVGLMIQRICDPWIAKVYADAGADFVYIENEHMFFNHADLSNLILSCRLCGLPVVAKSEYLSRNSIIKLLDAGVTGIQLPGSESANQIKELIQYVKFPPIGLRFAAPGTGNTDYEAVDCQSWIKEANDETVVVAHIETLEGIRNIDEILEVPQVDIMFVGMFDLSVSVGQPGRFEHPDVTAALEKLLAAAKAHDKVPGMWAPSYQAAKPWIKKGMRFIESTGDIGLIANGSAAVMQDFPGHSPKQAPGTPHT